MNEEMLIAYIEYLELASERRELTDLEWDQLADAYNLLYELRTGEWV